MKCPECGYNIPDGMHKCLCCGRAVTALRVLSEEELRRNGQEERDDGEGYKTIDPDAVYFGRGEPQEHGGGGLFDSLFGGSPFGGMFGSIGSIIGDLFGGFFGDPDDIEDDEESDREENYTYDALGNRVPKPPVRTMVVTDIEQYDENGELKSKHGKKKKKPKKDK